MSKQLGDGSGKEKKGLAKRGDSPLAKPGQELSKAVGQIQERASQQLADLQDYYAGLIRDITPRTMRRNAKRWQRWSRAHSLNYLWIPFLLIVARIFIPFDNPTGVVGHLFPHFDTTTPVGNISALVFGGVIALLSFLSQFWWIATTVCVFLTLPGYGEHIGYYIFNVYSIAAMTGVGGYTVIFYVALRGPIQNWNTRLDQYKEVYSANYWEILRNILRTFINMNAWIDQNIGWVVLVFLTGIAAYMLTGLFHKIIYDEDSDRMSI